jgi:hypothetical protein
LTHVKDVRLLPTRRRRGTARKLAIYTGLFRSVAGPVLLARPELLPQVLGVDLVTSRRTAWITRLLAGRELALGLGTLHAVATRRPLRPWLYAQALCDATDALALAAAARAGQVSTPRALAVIAFAAAGATGETLAREQPRPHPA